MQKKVNIDIFLKLYQKYLNYQMEKVTKAINELPIEVVKKCFRDKKFFEKEVDLSKINETEFGFNGLCAYQTIRDLANELIYYNYVLTKKELEFKIKNGCFK